MITPSIQKKQRPRKACLLLLVQRQTVSFNSNLPAPGPRSLAMEPVVQFSTTRTRSKPKIGSQPPIILRERNDRSQVPVFPGRQNISSPGGQPPTQAATGH